MPKCNVSFSGCANDDNFLLVTWHCTFRGLRIDFVISSGNDDMRPNKIHSLPFSIAD